MSDIDLRGKSLTELLAPGIWCDGFTTAELCELTGSSMRAMTDQIRQHACDGTVYVEVPSGRVLKRGAGAGIVATAGERSGPMVDALDLARLR
ncbi:hypothetical protein [Bradyrhizobium liaoningense]|uniref:hypothetical protein n=1 Tax=Bradyrhizobium liaoningense TaxID=43992 RepID=UPI001BAB4BCD|nr:hypothetical protein [Bradyrhizobium liaoningense]MBR0712691.1 hypothetical protein [Bradyrhizobium liaoningense]